MLDRALVLEVIPRETNTVTRIESRCVGYFDDDGRPVRGGNYYFDYPDGHAVYEYEEVTETIVDRRSKGEVRIDEAALREQMEK